MTFFQPLLELAAVLGAGDKRVSMFERHEPLAGQRITARRPITIRCAKPSTTAGLPDARFTDERRALFFGSTG